MAANSTVDRAGQSDGAREFQIVGHIESPTSGKTYVLDVESYHNYRIIGFKCGATGPGTSLDIELKKNTVGITGGDAVGVLQDGATINTETITGTVYIEVGDSFELVADNYTGGSPTDIYFTIFCREKAEVG